MGRVVFVIGLPRSGKSSFIKENFKEAKILDIWDYQHQSDSYIETVDGYMEILKDLIHEIVINEEYAEEPSTIVLEHTLIKSYRRPLYIAAIQSMCGQYNLDIDCYYTYPTAKQYTYMYYKDNGWDLDAMFDYRVQGSQSLLNQFDIPSKEEGFSNIYKIGCDL